MAYFAFTEDKVSCFMGDWRYSSLSEPCHQVKACLWRGGVWLFARHSVLPREEKELFPVLSNRMSFPISYQNKSHSKTVEMPIFPPFPGHARRRLDVVLYTVEYKIESVSRIF